jgi:ATP-dependent Lon protease
MTQQSGLPTPPGSDVPFGDSLPLLPLRASVLFPGAVAPFDCGRQKSVELVRDGDNRPDGVIAIFTQRDPSTDDPGKDDVYAVGCAARVLKALKHSSGNYSLIVQGLARVRLEEVTQTSPYLMARISRLDVGAGPGAALDDEVEALNRSLRDVAKEVITRMPELPVEAAALVDSITSTGALADLVAHNLAVPVREKVQLLETVDLRDRTRRVLALLAEQLEVLKRRAP